MKNEIPGNAPCPCPRSCKRRGRCEECVTWHKEHKKHPPYCHKQPKPQDMQAEEEA